MENNIIVAKFNGVRFPDTAPKYQYDYGQILTFEGIDLPQAFEVHFSNQMSGGDSITAVASGGSVAVPDDVFQSGSDIFAFIFVNTGDDDGETVYRIHIPVAKRPEITNLTPTPVQQDAIEQAIVALNDAVDLAEGYAEEIQNMTVTAETLPSGSSATVSYNDGHMYFGIPEGAQGEQGESGFSPTITVIDISGGHRVTITDSQGMESFDVLDGADGYSPTIAVSNITGGHRLTITDVNGTRTVDVLDGEQGQTGATGNGIASITKTSSVGLVDTYTIAFTDGNSTTFTVTNGADGTSDFAEYLPIDSASGSIASFPDGAKDIPVESLKVNISPVQNLNGQSNPYPAGGGVNKFDADNLETVTIVVSGGLDDRYGHTFTTAGTYAVKAYGTGTGNYLYARIKLADESWGDIYYIVAGSSGAPAIITVSEGQTLFVYDAIRDSASNSSAKFTAWKVQVALSSTQPSEYHPYSNICPIYGHTEANVVRCGKNLLQTTLESQTKNDVVITVNADGTIRVNGTATGDITLLMGRVTVLEDATYYASGCPSGGSANTYRMYCSWGVNETGTGVQRALTKGTVVTLTLAIKSGVTIDAVYKPMLCKLSSGTDYSPYNGNTYNIPFGSTVYGGSLEVETGVLTIDKAKKVFDGSSSDDIGLYNALTGFYFKLDGMSANYSPLGVCNMDKTRTSYGTGGVIFGISNNNYAYFTGLQTISGCSTVSDLLTWIQNNGSIEFVYPLATPTTVQLTPVEVETLLGQNNIYADCGTVEVVYRCDIQGYVDKKISALASLI